MRDFFTNKWFEIALQTFIREFPSNSLVFRYYNRFSPKRNLIYISSYKSTILIPYFRECSIIIAGGFTMKLVTRITIVFMFLLAGSTLSAQASTFPDVNESERFYDEIMYLVGKNVIQGYPSGQFGPDDYVTRSAAAIMIGRVLDYNGAQADTSFPDVPKSNKASGYIQKAYENNIIQGFPDGTFRPDEIVTREQMAIFLARAFDLTEEEVVPFNDISVQMKSFSSIRKVIAFGVTEGYPNGTFQPTTKLTRAQFSAFLARATSDEFRLHVKTCGYDATTKQNPNKQMMNCLLTKAALDASSPIPPEIVKAVASVESSWTQFKANGEPNISADGGIGVMQITNTTGYDVERLKHDVQYNIETGIEFLLKNFNRMDLPRINDHDPTKLESWYFAVMAYNGTKAENSPFYQETGERNTDAYQEKVYRELQNFGLLDTRASDIPMTKTDFVYNEGTNYTINFQKKNYLLDGTRTSTKQLFKTGDIVHYNGSGLRANASTQSTLTATTSSDSMTILGAPVYDERTDSTNQFVWYPVEVVKNGKTIRGYIASYLIVK